MTGPINVSSGTPRTIGELAGALHAVAHPTAPRPAVTGESRLGDVRHIFADPTLAARALGFRAREDFFLGVAELAGTLPMAA